MVMFCSVTFRMGITIGCGIVELHVNWESDEEASARNAAQMQIIDILLCVATRPVPILATTAGNIWDGQWAAASYVNMS